MTRYAYDRAAADLGMPGLVEIPAGLEITNIVDDLVLLAHASLENEWEVSCCTCTALERALERSLAQADAGELIEAGEVLADLQRP